jgi:hypothetical protein
MLFAGGTGTPARNASRRAAFLILSDQDEEELMTHFRHAAIAAALLAGDSAGFGDVADVFAVMARLADSGRLAWQVDVAPQDMWPERSVRALLSRVTDDGVREPAVKALG